MGSKHRTLTGRTFAALLGVMAVCLLGRHPLRPRHRTTSARTSGSGSRPTPPGTPQLTLFITGGEATSGTVADSRARRSPPPFTVTPGTVDVGAAARHAPMLTSGGRDRGEGHPRDGRTRGRPSTASTAVGARPTPTSACPSTCSAPSTRARPGAPACGGTSQFGGRRRPRTATTVTITPRRRRRRPPRRRAVQRQPRTRATLPAPGDDFGADLTRHARDARTSRSPCLGGNQCANIPTQTSSPATTSSSRSRPTPPGASRS